MANLAVGKIVCIAALCKYECLSEGAIKRKKTKATQKTLERWKDNDKMETILTSFASCQDLSSSDKSLNHVKTCLWVLFFVFSFFCFPCHHPPINHPSVAVARALESTSWFNRFSAGANTNALLQYVHNCVLKLCTQTQYGKKNNRKNAPPSHGKSPWGALAHFDKRERHICVFAGA